MSEWEAFLRQARSDYQVFALLLRLSREGVEECHALHYLQMTTEKIAKAALLASGVTFDKYSHVAFSHIPTQLARRDVARALGWGQLRPFLTFLRKAGPLFRAIDELHPAVGAQSSESTSKEGPNVEYPWRGRSPAGTSTWFVPAEHRFGLLSRLQRSREGTTLLVLIERLLERFHVLFVSARS